MSDNDIFYRSFDFNEKCKISWLVPGKQEREDQNAREERDDDVSFVGIKLEHDEDGRSPYFHVVFPYGFYMNPNNDNEIRADILLLMRTLERAYKRNKEINSDQIKPEDVGGFPLNSYVFIISDFLTHGCYRETETVFTVGKRGKIDWGKTIGSQKPYFQDNEVYYLDYVVRKSRPKEDSLITLIHEYCVYESFKYAGWLFTTYMPPKPRLTLPDELCLSVLNDKLKTTFDDRSRELFLCMRDVVGMHDSAGIKSDEDDMNRFLSIYGTGEFEDIWELMISDLYGVNNIEQYYPHTKWEINGIPLEDPYEDKHDLRPDTVMEFEQNLYILDAKYYKYYATGNSDDLPWAQDINKQITYGEYIVGKHSKEYDEIYNAFLLPFSANDAGTKQKICYVGCASGDWKNNLEPYQKIRGIMLDTKYVMKCWDGKVPEKLSKSVIAGSISQGSEGTETLIFVVSEDGDKIPQIRFNNE